MNSDAPTYTQTVKVSAFKAKCLQLLDKVAKGCHDIIITKNGGPVARLASYHKKFIRLFGAGQERIKIIGDIISPLDVEWEAESDPDRVINP